jgi:hypothetical protein
MGKEVNNELYQAISKISTWAFSLFAGVVGKISYDLYLKKKRSWLQWIGVTGISIFVGYMSMKACVVWGHEDKIGIVVPSCTLFGEKIIWWFTLKFDKIRELASEIVKK